MRRTFGGGPDAVVINPATGQPVPRARLTAWTAPTGGTQIRDLTTRDGRTVGDGQVVADDRGLITFLGPADGATRLWVDAGSGTRVLLLATDTDDRVDAVETGTARLDTVTTTATARVTALETSRAAPSGLATLTAGGKVPAGQMPPVPPGVLDSLADVDAPAPQPGQALVSTGTTWKAARPGRAGGTAAATPFPWIIAQEPDQFPRGSLAGIRWAAASGFPVLVFVSLGPDGALTLSAQSTLATNSDLLYRNASAHRVLDPTTGFETNYGPLTTQPTLAEVLDVCAGLAPVIVAVFGDDPPRAVARAVEIVRAHDMTEQVVLWPGVLAQVGNVDQSGRAEAIELARRSGCQVLWGTADIDNFDPADELLPLGLSWVMLYGYGLTAQNTRPLLDAGLKLFALIGDNQAERDRALAAGVHGVVTSSPLYLSDPSRYRRKSDPFGGQTRAPGMVAPYTSRPWVFSAPNWWRLPYGYGGFFTLQGWGCPMDVTPTAWTMTFDLRWDTVPADALRKVMVVVCSPTDEEWNSYQEPSGDPLSDDGYTCELDCAGGLKVVRWIGGRRLESARVATAAPTTGQIITYQITVTATAVTLTRVGAGAPNSVTLTDATWRGRYFFLGTDSLDENYLVVSVRNLSYV